MLDLILFVLFSLLPANMPPKAPPTRPCAETQTCTTIDGSAPVDIAPLMDESDVNTSAEGMQNDLGR